MFDRDIMLRKLLPKSQIDLKVENKAYEQVAAELREGKRMDGFWVRALERGKGNDERAKSEYIKLRSRSIMDSLRSNLIKEQQIAHAQKKEKEISKKADSERAARRSKIRRQLIVKYVDSRVRGDGELMNALIDLAEWEFEVRTFGSGWLIVDLDGNRTEFPNGRALIDHVTYLQTH